MSRLEIKTSKGVNYVNADYTIEEKQGEYPKLTCTIPASKNKIWIDDCKELDRLYTPGEQDEFVIINPVKITKGDSYDLEITAVGAFEFDFVKSRINDNLPTRSYTVEYLLDLVFKDTRYSYDLQGTYEKREFTNFGSDNRYKLFLQIMNRFNLEFKIIGKIVRINSKIGNDTGFQFRYLKNIKDTKYSVDATNLVTHVKGYGAYHDANDQSKGRLEVEYLSPLSDIYGKLSGEPVVDERMSISATLLEKCKQSVESSVAVTVSTTLVALKNQEYRGIARVGDSIWFIDERIELEKKIRFSTVKSYYDAFDELIKQDVQLGDKDVFSRAQSSDSASQSKLIDKQKELSDQLADVEDAIKKTYVMPSGVNRVFYSSDLPEDVPKGTIKEGDTLFRNIDGETKMYRWDGVQWELVPVVNHVEKFREELDNEIAQVNTTMQAQSEEHDRQVADISSKTQSVESLANQAKSDAASALARANQVKTEAIADARVQVATVSQALNTAKSELQSAIASADQKARDSQASATALRADLNLQASKILAQAQAQTALTNRVSTVETLADGTKTTVAELSKTVSKATGDITSVTSRTKTVEDTLSQTRTKYEALTQTVNAQTGQIESINRKTADLQSGIDGVTERFESLRIEDNLLLNSSFNENLNQWQGTGVTIVDGKARIIGELNKTKYIYQSIKSQIANDDVSQVYIASISVKVTNYVAGSINPFLALYIDGKKNDSAKTWFGGTYRTANRLDAVNNRGIVQFTTTFKVNVPRSQIGALNFHVYARDFTGEVEFEKVSLRRGDIDLGWQASPEDLRSEIATYKRSAEESSAELSRQIQLADGKAVEAKTYAQQTAEGFKTRLESLETYKDGESTRASQYFTASRDETARQITAERTTISDNYVAKSTYDENVRGTTLKLNEIKSTADNTKQNLATYQNTVDGKLEELTSSTQTLDGEINTASAKITQNAQEISKRLTSTQVDKAITDKGYQTKSDVDNNITGRGYITSSALQPYALSTTVQNLVKETAGSFERQITETRGLIPTEVNQNLFDVVFSDLRATGGASFVQSDDGWIEVTIKNRWSGFHWLYSDNIKPSEKQYVLSYEAYLVDTVANTAYLETDFGSPDQLTLINKTPKRYTVVLNRPANIYSYINFVCNSSETGKKFRIRNIKLEEGIVATPYIAPFPTTVLFNAVKDTVDAHKRLIGNGDSISQAIQSANKFELSISSGGDIYQAIETAKGLVTEVSGTNGLKTQVSTLAGSYAVKNLTSTGNVLNQLNLNKDGSVKLDGSLVQITGKTYIENGVIKEAMIGKGQIGTAHIGEIDAGIAKIINLDVSNIKGLDAEFIKAKIENAFIEWMKGKTITAQNEAMTIGLNDAFIRFKDNAKIEFQSENNTLYRTKNGTSAFIHFRDDSYNGVYTAMGVNADNTGTQNDYSSGSFAGVRVIRSNPSRYSGKVVDQVQLVGDEIRIRHGYGYENDYLVIKWDNQGRIDLIKFLRSVASKLGLPLT
ncbi:TPA: phage tail protein [Streptococcus suis]|nr:phage tail protein [Streptococcus suis]HEM6295130.1 phage tail protein [Streptococcus suis]HEM6418869.1 phage tail protein [Streptococcus suis]HEM6424734.1 phage tail protein [Streptococcus suis]